MCDLGTIETAGKSGITTDVVRGQNDLWPWHSSMCNAGARIQGRLNIRQTLNSEQQFNPGRKHIAVGRALETPAPPSVRRLVVVQWVYFLSRSYIDDLSCVYASWGGSLPIQLAS